MTMDSTKIKYNEFNEVSFEYLSPETRSNTDHLKVYIWHTAKTAVYVKELIVYKFEEE